LKQKYPIQSVLAICPLLETDFYSVTVELAAARDIAGSKKAQTSPRAFCFSSSLSKQSSANEGYSSRLNHPHFISN